MKRNIVKTYFCALLVFFAVCKNSIAQQRSVELNQLEDLKQTIGLHQPENLGQPVELNQPHQHTKKTNNTADKEVRAIAQLTHILHQAIADENFHIHSARDFLKVFRDKQQWTQLLNFHKITRQAVRAFNMASDKSNIANHAKNLALLFPLSHFIEVMTAPAFAAFGAVNGFPSIVIGVGGSLLSIIAVPGLDPLCILLFFAYPLKPVHKSIDFIRNLAEKSVRGMAVVLKLDVLLSKTYTYEDRFHFIKKEIEAGNKLNRLFDIELTHFIKTSQLSISSKTGNKILSLKRIWDSKTNQFYIANVWVSHTAESVLITQGLLNLLSWNARSAVRELLKIKGNKEKILIYERKFFVDRITVQGDGMEVVYKEKAINLKDRLRLRKIFKPSSSSSCSSSFQDVH